MYYNVNLRNINFFLWRSFDYCFHYSSSDPPINRRHWPSLSSLFLHLTQFLSLCLIVTVFFSLSYSHCLLLITTFSLTVSFSLSISLKILKQQQAAEAAVASAPGNTKKAEKQTMIPLTSPSGPISNSSSSDSNSVTDKESKDKDKDSKGEKSARDRSAQQPAGKIHQISQISIFCVL